MLCRFFWIWFFDSLEARFVLDFGFFDSGFGFWGTQVPVSSLRTFTSMDSSALRSSCLQIIQQELSSRFM